jgi:hypothetical protein
MNCNHFDVDEDTEACGHCKDEWYIGSEFEFNNRWWVIKSFYGTDHFTGEDTYVCHRLDGGGSVFLDTDTLELHGIEPFEPTPVNEV